MNDVIELDTYLFWDINLQSGTFNALNKYELKMWIN